MEYPEEVQENLDVLNTYKEVDKLDSVDIIHLYPEKIAYPNGYYDSMFFTLWAFNARTMEKTNLGQHDGMTNYNDGVLISMIRVFADGSTFIRFKKPIALRSFQDVEMLNI